MKSHLFFFPMCFRFVEGMLNICYNAIDRHIENGQGDKIAIIYDSPVTDTKATITYKEVLEQVMSQTVSPYWLLYKSYIANVCFDYVAILNIMTCTK